MKQGLKTLEITRILGVGNLHTAEILVESGSIPLIENT